VRHVPLDWSKEKLEGVLEDHFKLYGLNVNYVNFCFDITEMVKLNKKMGELIKLKNLVKQHLKKGMKEKGINKRQLIQDPS
jgi:DNA polymerase sigma